MPDLTEKSFMYKHFPKHIIDRLRAQEIAAANDLIATQEDRNYLSLQSAADVFKQLNIESIQSAKN